MAAPSADCTFWGFLWYLRHNPFKTFGGMTEDDLIATAKLFAATNSDALSATDPGTYTDVEFPSAVTGAQTTAACDQALYPESHKGH
jgi:hypothetical protein